MPVTPVGAASVITPNLIVVGMLGTGVPQFSLGLGHGLTLWAPSMPVKTVDTGSLGVGVGTVPLVVPPPLLLVNLLVAFTTMGLMGVMAPLKCQGLSVGMSLAFAQGIVTTTHPMVGTGACVCSFTPPAPPIAVPIFVQGFALAGVTGTSIVQLSTAISMALFQTFTSYVLPSPIVGSASPTAGGGVGFGSIA